MIIFILKLIKHNHNSATVLTVCFYINGKCYVHYQMIGPHDVAVPTHFFKILILDDGTSQKQTLAYILPNEKIEATVSLESFRTTIEKVGQVAGFVFSKF